MAGISRTHQLQFVPQLLMMSACFVFRISETLLCQGLPFTV